MKLLDVVLQTATLGRSQVFLGAPWIPFSVARTPRRWRERVALEWLALSPHYFFRAARAEHPSREQFLRAEWSRNVASRKVLIEDIVQPYVNDKFTVLDYGCGPGFLAAQTSLYARQVIACDISPGVLACAGVLNGRPNIEYVAVQSDGHLPVAEGSVDFVYSFAVIQHISDEAFETVLRELHRLMKPGARACIHVVLTTEAGWKTEDDWRQDLSVRGRAKWLFGLHCFGRTAEHVIATVTAAGFCKPDIKAVNVPRLEDDIARQHLVIFEKAIQ